MSTNKVNVFINSKNCIKTSERVFVNLPNSYISCKRGESWSVQVKSFQSVITWYSIQYDYNDALMISDNENFDNPTHIRLDEGSPSIYELVEELNEKLEHISVEYIQRTNKLFFQSKDENTYYLKCLTCSQFLGFDNNDVIPIYDGIYSDFVINMTSDQLLYVKIDGDIGLNNAGLTNIDTPEFYPSDILFSFVVNQVPNSLIDYQSPYEDRWKIYISTQSDTIDQFSLRIENEEGRTLKTFNDFIMHLQFDRLKDENRHHIELISVLNRIANYIRELYLIAANYLKM